MYQVQTLTRRMKDWRTQYETADWDRAFSYARTLHNLGRGLVRIEKTVTVWEF